MTVLAHGIGTRGDLPLPTWMFAYGAGAVVVLSFVALGALWRTSRLDGKAPGRPLPPAAERIVRSLEWPVRVIVLVVFALTLGAALFGPLGPEATIAPVTVYVVFWVGVQFASMVLGDVWAVVSPWDTLVALAERLGWRPPPRPRLPRPSRTAAGLWALAAIVAFAWMELVHPQPADTRLLGVLVLGHTVAAVGGGLLWGRSWLRQAEGFTVLFSYLGAMGIFHQRADGRLGVRPPFSGLASVPMHPTAMALILALLGSTTFDGLTRTELYRDLIGARTGWEAVPLATALFAAVLAAVGFAYVLAMGIAAAVVRDRTADVALRFAHSLVPIAFAYSVAHYFSLLVFEGQGFPSRLSDPLGQGWDLFGTAGDAIDYRVLSTTTIAWIQVAAIVIGHVVGVVLAHDRAVARYDAVTAARSQYALLAIMVGYTVLALVLLLEA